MESINPFQAWRGNAPLQRSLEVPILSRKWDAAQCGQALQQDLAGGPARSLLPAESSGQLFPAAISFRRKQGVNDAHIANRVFNAVRQRDFAAHHARKRITLQGVLVAGRQRLTTAARPPRIFPSSMKILVSTPGGALKGISISSRFFVPMACTRWKGVDWVETLKSSLRPLPKSSRALVCRSVLKTGSRSTSEITRCGSASNRKRPATIA